VRATIQMINARTGMVAAHTSDRDYTVFELRGDDVEIGDIVEGELHALGSGTFLNVTQRHRIEVHVQAIHCSRQSATTLLGG
jgi:hypothetical protein